MKMIDCYVDAFRKFFDFTGRANRPAYWWFCLANFIVTEYKVQVPGRGFMRRHQFPHGREIPGYRAGPLRW